MRATAALALLGWACASPESAPGPAPVPARPRPNIVFVFSDDHAAHAISAYGSRINRTPHIDRLAAEGMRFANCFCTNAICAPSRAVILTGKHSHQNGQITNDEAFDGRQVTFPKLLQQAGYQTALVGKWHLRTDPTGFDHWEVLRGQGPYWNPTLLTAHGEVATEGYTTDLLTDRALAWLGARDSNRPFLLMLQHKAPHREWQPGPAHARDFAGTDVAEPPTLFDDWQERNRGARTQQMTVAEHLTDLDLKLVPPRGLTAAQLRFWHETYDAENAAFRAAGLSGTALTRWKYQRYIKDYLRCVASVDDSVGRVLDWLDGHGLRDDTVVIYCSDQGFYLGDHGWFDKRWMYEESLRMPLLVRWPGQVAAGSTQAALVQNLDFASTFLELAGAPLPADLQGHSLLPLLRGTTPPDWRRSVYYHYWEFPGDHHVPRHCGVRTERYKLVHYYQSDEWELFDLQQDPQELRSRHADPELAAVRAQLQAELRRLQEECGDTDPARPRAGFRQRSHQALAAQTVPAQVFAADGPDAPVPDLDPSSKAFTVSARCTPGGSDGVLLAQGGERFGWSLYLLGGQPRFAVRDHGELRVVAGPALPTGRAVRLAGQVDGEGMLHLLVDGQEVARAPGLVLTQKPTEPVSLGRDAGTPVGEYQGSLPFAGELRDLRVEWGVSR